VNSYYIMCLDNFSSTTTPFVFDWALSGVVLNCSIYLPVELIDFGGEETGPVNTLFWKTESEINNERFEIWSSSDGSGYSKIGEVDGSGTSQVVRDYQFFDRSPLALTTYYKLKQFDYNGTFQWSETIAVARQATISVAPNPVEELLSISCVTSSDVDITLQLTDISGRIIVSQKLQGKQPDARVQWNLSGIPVGLYQIMGIAESGAIIFSEKVLRN
jgi:hypothetical protein